MDRFASMAEEHWRRHLPDAYSRLSDRDGFFAELGAEAQAQMEDLEDHLRGDDPPGEPFAERMTRFQRARQTAEEIVVREVILGGPSPPAESPPDQADPEFEDAVADFYRLREQLHDALDSAEE
jgi:hypothetical protein